MSLDNVTKEEMYRLCKLSQGLMLSIAMGSDAEYSIKSICKTLYWETQKVLDKVEPSISNRAVYNYAVEVFNQLTSGEDG